MIGRQVILLLVLSSFFLNCGNPLGPDEKFLGVIEIAPADLSSVPYDIQEAYKWDAGQLVFRHIFDNELREREQIELPENMMRSFFYALAHIYNATHIPERDTVIDKFNIRPLPHRRVDKIIIAHDGSKPYAKNWGDGYRFTGYEPIDWLLTKYELFLKEYYIREGKSNLAILNSEKPLNTIALSEKFITIDGIEWAEPGVVGSINGSDVRARSFIGYIRLDYYARHFFNRTWSFRVDKMGKVTLVGASNPLVGAN